MPSLADTQRALRDVVTGRDVGAALAIAARGDARARLAIYRRHHRESFRRHLRGRYPTLEWLLGTGRLIDIADATLREAPPQAPSMAEYGAELIDTLLRDGEDLPPYVPHVARLDWALGCISVAIERPAIAIAELAAVAEAELDRVTLTLQPGLAHLAAPWPVDELVEIRLAGSAPDTLHFDARDSWLELRGARGRFGLRRLAQGDFTFRAAIARGESLGAAAEAALACDHHFNVAAALAALFAEGLVIQHSGETHHA